jgi:hypothetical protein
MDTCCIINGKYHREKLNIDKIRQNYKIIVDIKVNNAIM